MAASNKPKDDDKKDKDAPKTGDLQAAPHNPTETGKGEADNAGVVHTHAGAPDAPVPTPQAAPKAKHRVQLIAGIHHEGGVTYEKGAVFNSITDLATRFPEKFKRVPKSFEEVDE